MFYTTSGNIKLHYEMKGKKDNNVILFIHGNKENIHVFDSFESYFSEYCQLYVDLRGHGESDMASLQYSFMADDLIDLLNHLGISKCDIIASKEGGNVGLLIGLFSDKVRRLFALGTAASPYGLKTDVRKEIESKANCGDIFSQLVLKEPFIEKDDLEDIKNRVILINGENDIIREDHIDFIASSLPNCCRYIIDNASHDVILDSFEKVISIIKNELKLEILYEDNHVLVVDKEAGLLSQADKSGDMDLLTLGKSYLKEKYHKEGNVYLSLAQRLDRNVSGIIVLAKTSKAAERLNQNRPIKTYLAIVYGKPKKKEDTLIHYLSKDEETRRAIEDANGKKAILNYTVLDYHSSLDVSLLKVTIETGRFHQIRKQLSLLGNPIVNDYKYNQSIEKNDNFIGLDAYKCTFIHPVKAIEMTFSRYPKHSIYELFVYKNKV